MRHEQIAESILHVPGGIAFFGHGTGIDLRIVGSLSAFLELRCEVERYSNLVCEIPIISIEYSLEQRHRMFGVFAREIEKAELCARCEVFGSGCSDDAKLGLGVELPDTLFFAVGAFSHLEQ